MDGPLLTDDRAPKSPDFQDFRCPEQVIFSGRVFEKAGPVHFFSETIIYHTFTVLVSKYLKKRFSGCLAPIYTRSPMGEVRTIIEPLSVVNAVAWH